jgi:predicted permease
MVASVLLKIAILPVLVYALGRFLVLDPVSMRIALVFAATPTASAAFVMARQMEGDESVASGAIVLSTIFSAISLFLVLWFTQ